MKINFNSALIEKKPIMIGSGSEDVPMLLKDAALMALGGSLQDDKPTDEQRAAYKELYFKIAAGVEVELTSAEIDLLKERIGLGYSARVKDASFDILNGTA